MNLTFNRNKCEFNKRHLSFFGHVWSPEGISADPKKLEAIRNLKTPENPDELRSLLGMASYVSRIIPNFATVTEPLRRLTRVNTPWEWGTEQKKALEELHSLLKSNTTMAYYNPAKHTELVVDASPVGLGAILAQKDNKEDQGGKIVAYASRALTDVETRYSQTEREALAVAWGAEKFHLYVYGKPIEIFTDHKPLEGLFNNPKSKPNARIERWLIKMQDRYDYKVIYRPGKNPENPADYLSRHAIMPSSKASKEARDTEQYVNFIEKNALPKALSADEVKIATLEDATLQKVIDNLKKGCWNDHPGEVDVEAVKNMRRLKDELAITKDGLLLRGTKLVIPKKLQERVIELAHQGHQGIVKTKRLIREKVWFPGIDKQVEEQINNCLACQASTHDTKSKMEPLKMSELPEGPWQKVDIDFCGPFPSGDYLLVAIDEYSRFPEVEITKSTSAYATITKLDKMFSVHGIPEEVKSDNGPPFQSEDFKQFSKHLGFRHRRVTPGYPQANGEVERFMRTLEKAVRCAIIDGKSWKQELYRFLRNYRITPHSSTGVPPGEALFNRSVRSTLPEIRKSPAKDIIMRETDAKAKMAMKEYADNRANAKHTLIKPGDMVLVKQEKLNKYTTPFKPKPYEVVARKGNMITANNAEHEITRNVSKFKPVSLKFKHQIYEPVEDQFEIEEEERKDDSSEGATGHTPPSPVKSPYKADLSRYPIRSTRNTKPVWMSDFETKT